MQTKVHEKKNGRDEFLVFCERELERWQGVMYVEDNGAITDEIQKVWAVPQNIRS